ncbi:hypothetical protein BKA57DRAFT_537280 [Linnemannia elongata]|nr:hypothetical protein BKA57DRAFT_537280 [Linnemannia elongata]
MQKEISFPAMPITSGAGNKPHPHTSIVDEGRLYIQGGTDQSSRDTNQFIALDLTVDSWSTSDPPWIAVQSYSEIPLVASGHSMTVSSDRSALFMWVPFESSVFWAYYMESRTWGSFSYPQNTTKKTGIRNGVDMRTGIVYVPFGNNNGKEMSFLWSTLRSRFLLYGGAATKPHIGNPYLNEYNPDTHEWAVLTTTGPSPGDISAYNGTKLIVFGGIGLYGFVKSSIYTLDARTLEWTAGKPADINQGRRLMACAVSGDSFIAWGGYGASGFQDAVPIVYDMKKNQWTTQFNRVSNSTSTTTGPTKVTSPPTNTAAIGGGIAGAVVVVVAVVGFLLYRHRRRSRTRTRNGSHQDRDEDEEGVSLAHRQKLPPNNNDDIDAEQFAASHPPPLKPRPAEDRHALMSCLSPSSLTELPLAGPHTVPRDPHGQQLPQQFTFTNNGGRSGRVDANNEAHDQVTLLPGPQSNQSDNINIYKGSTGNPRSPRNPQSLNPYEERSQEVRRMIANLQTEQEELQRVSVSK